MNKTIKVNTNWLSKYASLNKYEQTILIQTINLCLGTTIMPKLANNMLELYIEAMQINGVRYEKK